METSTINDTSARANAPASTPAGAAGRSTYRRGVHRGIWIGGGLMALTIIALATTLVVRGKGSDDGVAATAIPGASADASSVAAAASPDAAAPAVIPVQGLHRAPRPADHGDADRSAA
ncbi:MAG: hypothetical protein ABW032_12315, partial [Burkholderiaceae bacterium]